MKEISECIRDIWQANSSIFTTLDLTSGFWQMKLDPESQPLTAFTIPNRGQFHWMTSPMGLLGCPASFQRLMEQVLRGLNHILIYIDDVLIHTVTHEKHLEALEQVLLRLHQHHLKINLDKCLFGDRQVSYLGFTLTPEGIKPGKAKLKSIKQVTPPDDVKGIRSFMGLCNFFRHHIQDFSIIAAPLFKLTRQDSEYQSGPLTKEALTAFQTLKTQLTKQPALAFPRHDREYLLITNAYLPDKSSPGGLCANLAQRDHLGQIQIISHASRQLRENEKNYTRFLLETAAAAWGMDNFNEYLKGLRFTLYKDNTTETTLGTTQLKTLNGLRNTMIEHDFKIRNRQKADLPDFLKKRQIQAGGEIPGPDRSFNKVIHVDLIKTDPYSTAVPDRTILSITDDTRAFSQITVLTNDKIDSIAAAIWHHWCQPYGTPEMILSNQGKVWTSKLGSRINKFMPLEQRISCQSEKEIFNQEVRQQWQQGQSDTTAEEFAQHWNFLSNLQGPVKSKPGPDGLDEVDQNLDDVEDFVEEEPSITNHCVEVLGPGKLLQRKQVSLCRHKLQRRAYPKVKKAETITRQPEQLLEPESLELDHEWLQLIQMEKAIEEKKNQLLGPRAQNHWDPDEDPETVWDDEKGLTERDDHLDDGDMEYINDLLNSFSKPVYNYDDSHNLTLESLTPKDALARALASQATPEKFNLNFNQNSMTRGSEEEHFSYFSNVEEDRDSELGDYFSDDEEDNIWDQEDLTSEGNQWSHTEFNKSEQNFTHSPTTLSEWDPVISGLETINEARFEDGSKADNLNHISGFSENTKLAFSTWRPFIHPEPAFQNYAAHSQPWDFLSQASSSQEPTRIQISTITTSTKQTQPPIRQTSPRPKTSLLQLKAWLSLEPTTRPFTTTWTKFQTGLKKTSNSWRQDFPDHPEPSKQCKPLKQQSQCSIGHIQTQNTRSQNTPPVRDDGDGPQVCNQLELWSSSTTKPKRSTTKIGYWGTQWCKFSNKTPICQTKSPKYTRPLRRNSRRITQPIRNTKSEWPDLQDPGQHPRRKQLQSGSYESWQLRRSRSKQSAHWKKGSTSSQTQFRKISKCQSTEYYTRRNLSSKRRSESEGHYETKPFIQHKRLNSKSESESKDKKYCQHQTQNFKSKIENKNAKVKAIKVRKVKALTTMKAKSTAKVNEVKVIEKTLTGFRIDGEKQVDNKIGPETTVTLLSRFPNMFNILSQTPIVIFHFMSIFKSVRSDLLNHQVRPFTIKILSDCKTICLSQQTASVQATTILVKTLANPDSRRPVKVPET